MTHPASSDMQPGGEVSRTTPAKALGPELGSLLVIKLIVPPTRIGALPRARLFTELDAALAVPLTLVVAPAGFGTTTLLTGWLQRMAEGRRPQGAGSESQPTARSARPLPGSHWTRATMIQWPLDARWSGRSGWAGIPQHIPMRETADSAVRRVMESL